MGYCTIGIEIVSLVIVSTGSMGSARDKSHVPSNVEKGLVSFKAESTGLSSTLVEVDIEQGRTI